MYEGDDSFSKSVDSITNDNVFGGDGNDDIATGGGDDIVWAGPGNDTIYDEEGTNWLFGQEGDDVFRFFDPTKWDDLVYGGSGIDQVQVSPQRSSWLILSKQSTNEYTLSKGSNSLQLVDIERIKFFDKWLAIDTNGNAGQIFRLYKAAFNRDPQASDKQGLGYWIAQSDLGTPLLEISARFVDSNEFRTLYGTNPTNEQFLTKLYTNVLGRQPEATGYNWWLNELNTNPEKTKAKVLADFAESSENQTGVINLIGNGITYEPWVG
jgi:hypothetical protein